MPAYSLFCLLYLIGIIVVTIPYRNVAGRLRAFESASRSPLSSYIIEIARGKTTFRAFGNLDYGLAKLGDMLENHIVLSFQLRMVRQWYAVRLGLLAGVATIAIALYLGKPSVSWDRGICADKSSSPHFSRCCYRWIHFGHLIGNLYQGLLAHNSCW